MSQKRRNAEPRTSTAATVGHEAELWRMADALRGSMDAAEYKHVVLGLIFLKYVSDAFDAHRAKLESQRDRGADPEDPDEYRADNIFWVPPEARWSHLKAQARQPTIGQLVDDAMEVIERDNPSLKGVLPKDYARPALDKQRLGQLIDLISNIRVGDEAARAVGRSGDAGIDGIIKEDRLGLDVVYIQAKRWAQPVNRPEIQKFAGALQGHRARKGVFITTSTFSKEAQEYVERIESKIVLIDGERLAELMFEYNVGVSTVGTYSVKRVDNDFFLEE